MAQDAVSTDASITGDTPMVMEFSDEYDEEGDSFAAAAKRKSSGRTVTRVVTSTVTQRVMSTVFSTMTVTAACSASSATIAPIPTTAIPTTAPTNTPNPGTGQRGSSCSNNSACSTGLSCVDSICQIFWESKDFSDGGFSASWKVAKDGYGSQNRKLVPDPAGTGETVMQITYPKGSMNPGSAPRLPLGGTGVS
jgi:hypothetical protein